MNRSELIIERSKAINKLGSLSGRELYMSKIIYGNQKQSLIDQINYIQSQINSSC